MKLWIAIEKLPYMVAVNNELREYRGTSTAQEDVKNLEKIYPADKYYIVQVEVEK